MAGELEPTGVSSIDTSAEVQPESGVVITPDDQRRGKRRFGKELARIIAATRHLDRSDTQAQRRVLQATSPQTVVDPARFGRYVGEIVNNVPPKEATRRLLAGSEGSK